MRVELGSFLEKLSPKDRERVLKIAEKVTGNLHWILLASVAQIIGAVFIMGLMGWVVFEVFL